MTPADRVERMFFALIALGAAVGVVVLIWRACQACRVWLLR